MEIVNEKQTQNTIVIGYRMVVDPRDLKTVLYGFSLYTTVILIILWRNKDFGIKMRRFASLRK